MVISFPEYPAIRPAGNSLEETILETPLVACVIFVSTVFTHKLGELDAKSTVRSSITVIVPVAVALPQPSGIIS